MSMIDFDIGTISHNAHSTSLFSLAKVKCIRILSGQSAMLFKMAPLVLCIMLPLYSANPKLDYFRHVMKSIKKRYVCVVFEFLVCHWNH